MAEITNTSNDATSNTSTTTTGSNTSVKRSGTSGAASSGTSAGGDDTLTNTTVVDGAPAGNDEAVKAEGSLLPFPHNNLNEGVTEGTVYKDLIADVYKEHEKALGKDDSAAYEPDDEALAARMDSQERLANELRATLKAQRTMKAYASGEKSGGVKVRLKQEHTDGGVFYKKGDEIYVDKTVATFLLDAKIAEKV
jgi:hypothetical protein